jgi:hypothetical protein
MRENQFRPSDKICAEYRSKLEERNKEREKYGEGGKTK